MKAVVIKETEPQESRVALMPSVIAGLRDLGIEVLIEAGAGLGSSAHDQAYKDAGAEILEDLDAGLAEADLVLAVQPNMPELMERKIKKGALVIGLLNPYHLPESLVTQSVRQGIHLLSLEKIPRISRAQACDVLSSQANLAGYRAVIEAAVEYGRAFPLMMTAAGTIKPARVLVLGAGVAGLQAIATAKRLGAVVYAYDVRPEVREQVESLGGKFVHVAGLSASDSKETGGYAQETTESDLKKQQETLAQEISKADVVITTAVVPGKKAPILVRQEAIHGMRAGSVIVDMAVETGGNVEGSVIDSVTQVGPAKVVGYRNLPSRMAAEASGLYAKNIVNLLKLAEMQDGKIKLNFDDPIFAQSVLTCNKDSDNGENTTKVTQST